jgi:thiol:disulfide interchange protein
MNATLSTRQIQFVALIVLLVVVGGGFLVVTKHKSTTSTTASSTPTRTTHATTTPTPSKTHTHTATPTKLQTHGLPVAVARALRHHKVVVVSLTAPRGGDDQFTASEAQAGAAEMDAGYVAVDVFHQRPGSAILHKLGVVDTPAVLVVKRNGTIFSYFHGFVDRDVVAQAVANAR